MLHSRAFHVFSLDSWKGVHWNGVVDSWFNEAHNLNITKPDLIQLLEEATKNQLVQSDGKLYEQIDDVAVGSPLGHLMANAFLCSMEEK